MVRINRKFGLVILGGLLLALSLPPQNLSWLVWFGLTPIFTLLITGKLTSRQAWYFGILTGFIYFGLAMRWFFSVDMAQVAGIESRWLGLTLIIIVWLLSTLAMSITWGLYIWIFNWLLRQRRDKLWLQAFVAGSGFALAEYLRSFVFELIWWGNGTVWGANWTIVSPVYSLANHALMLRISAYIGTHGLAMLVAIIGFVFAKIILEHREKNWRAYLKLGVGLLVMPILFWSFNFILPKDTKSGNTINFALAQTNEPTEYKQTEQDRLKIFNRQLQMIRDIADQAPETNLILLPETSDLLRYLNIFMTPIQIQNYFQKLFDQPVTIVSSTRQLEKAGYFSRVVFLNSKRGLLGYSDKHVLTPNGEYIPYIFKPFLSRLAEDNLQSFKNIREYLPGPFPGTGAVYDGKLNITAGICTEFASPAVIRQLARNSDVVVGLANAGGFNGSSTLLAQNLALSRLRAAENRTAILITTNQGISYAINALGSVTDNTQTTGQKLLTGHLYSEPTKSWYNKRGNSITLALFLAFLVTTAQSLYYVYKKHFGRHRKPLH